MSDAMLFYTLCSVLLLAVCVGALVFVLWACMPGENEEDEDDATQV